MTPIQSTDKYNQPMNFDTILEKYRKISFSERDKGDRFERLMKAIC